MRVKWHVRMIELVEVEADLSGITMDEIINMAHGPQAVRRGVPAAEVIAVEIDGVRYEAPPF